MKEVLWSSKPSAYKWRRFLVMSHHQPLDSVVFLSLSFQDLNEVARAWWKTLCSVVASQAQDHIEKQLSSHVEPRIVFWDVDMFLVLVKSINHCKTPKISLRSWSMYCWDLRVYKWHDLGLWLTSLAEWEVCYDWSIVDGSFWLLDDCQGRNVLKRHFLT